MKKKMSIVLLAVFAAIQLGYAAYYRTSCGVEIETASRVSYVINGGTSAEFDAYLNELDGIYCD